MLGYLYGAGEITIPCAITCASHGCLIAGSSSDSFTALPNRALSTAQEVGIKIATPAGVLLGQLLFGWLGDVLGRKRICMSVV